MRSTATILAGFVVIAAFIRCGGDTHNGPPITGTSGGAGGEDTAGSGASHTGATGAGDSAGGSDNGGDNGGTTGTGASSTSGGSGNPPTSCDGDNDCEDNQQCVNKVCKSEDGEDCDSEDDCINTCNDGTCSSALPDGEDCESNATCAHTCIDGTCAPRSDVGGDCDDDDVLGGGGSGSGGAGSAIAPDCNEPFVCTDGTCLTPDGESCVDNVDCANTCIASECAPLGGQDDECDDNDDDDCDDGYVCDGGTCKKDLLETCTSNAQCESNKCICSNATCSVRTCKTAASTCTCKWSPTDVSTCSDASANLNSTVEDPNGCTGANFCHESSCVPKDYGTCSQTCDADCLATTPADSCTVGRHPEPSCSFSKTCISGCSCVLD